MIGPTPAEAAMDAYSDALTAAVGRAPSPYSREQDRALLHANPAIKAMLDAHERAVRQACAEEMAEVVENTAFSISRVFNASPKDHLDEVARRIRAIGKREASDGH